MMALESSIHPTAVIEPGAVIGAGCVIHAYAIVTRHAELAERVVVHPFTVVGGDPQDLRFDAAIKSGVRIGAGTVLREHVTIHRATKPETFTEVGAGCYLMASSHVAHDCRIGDKATLANAVLLGGHVQVGDGVFLGGSAAFHQFCRVGEGAVVGGLARITRDIPPFTMTTERDELNGLNVVGLRRRALPKTTLEEIKQAYRTVCVPVGNMRELAAAALASGSYASPEAQRFLQFFTGGKRGFVRPRTGGDSDEAQAD
jgi:UDP-N-acetylglucosamine acyltransferase